MNTPNSTAPKPHQGLLGKSSKIDLAKQPQRSLDWPRHQKPLFVLLDVFAAEDLVDITEGHISSTKTSHPGVNNVDHFMVWHTKTLGAKNSHSHERVYERNDPSILSYLEVGYLHNDPMRVFHWFGGHISMDTAHEIAQLLETILTNSLDRL
jgi:hypothetical protein